MPQRKRGRGQARPAEAAAAGRAPGEGGQAVPPLQRPGAPSHPPHQQRPCALPLYPSRSPRLHQGNTAKFTFSQKREKLPYIFQRLTWVTLTYSQWDWVDLLSLSTCFLSSCSFSAQVRDNRPRPPQLPTHHSSHRSDRGPPPSAAANVDLASERLHLQRRLHPSTSSFKHCQCHPAKHGR